MSRILIEFESEFEEFVDYDYLKLAQLLDPRVSIAESPTGIKSLLKILVDVYVPKLISETEVNHDPWAEAVAEEVNDAYASEIQVLKQHMMKVKVRKTDTETGVVSYEYYGGVERQQDIDFFGFYGPIAHAIPNIGIGIRKVTGHPPTTSPCERSFNVSGNILNIRRCSLDPDRAEKLIISAIRYKSTGQRKLKPPIIPTLGVLLDVECDEEIDEEELESQEDDAAAWESFHI